MHFRLYRIGNLDLEATIEVLEVAGPPVLDDRIGDELKDAPPKRVVGEEGRHLEDSVLTAPADGACRADHLIRFEQGEQREAEGVLHPHPPESGTASPSPGHSRPASSRSQPARVEQVQAERPIALRRVQVDDIVAAAAGPARARPRRARGADRRRPAPVAAAVAVDPMRSAIRSSSDDFPRWVWRPGAGAGRAARRARDRHRPPLVGRDADATPVRNRERPGQAAPSAGPLEQRHVRQGLREVPEAGEFARVENGPRPGRGQRTQLAQVEVVLAEASRLQAIAGRQVELPIRRRESIQAFVHRRGAVTQPAPTSLQRRG